MRRNVKAELHFIIRRHLPTSFSDMLGTSIPNKNMTSILGKGRMFSHEPKIFWLSRMEATKSNVFQTIEIVMAWSCRYLEKKNNPFSWLLFESFHSSENRKTLNTTRNWLTYNNFCFINNFYSFIWDLKNSWMWFWFKFGGYYFSDGLTKNNISFV